MDDGLDRGYLELHVLISVAIASYRDVVPWRLPDSLTRQTYAGQIAPGLRGLVLDTFVGYLSNAGPQDRQGLYLRCRRNALGLSEQHDHDACATRTNHHL